jgi:hypothetical protein
MGSAYRPPRSVQRSDPLPLQRGTLTSSRGFPLSAVTWEPPRTQPGLMLMGVQQR